MQAIALDPNQLNEYGMSSKPAYRYRDGRQPISLSHPSWWLQASVRSRSV